MTTKESPRSVEDTVARLKGVLESKGIKLFAVIDYSGEAEAVGLELRDTKVVIFGSPLAGTPVMSAAPLAGARPAAKGPRLGRRRPDEGQLRRAAGAGRTVRA